MKRKSDVQIIFPKFKTLVENFHKQQIKILYTDNGGKYIGHHTTPPHTPEHNGISERRNRHIAETGLALLHHSGIPFTYWPHTMTTAAYLINRLPTPIFKYQSPYFKLHNISPDYHILKCFGCLCFPWIKPYANHKLTPKSSMCVFVGYSADQHAYLCLDPTTDKIYTSCHVKFVESEFPFSSLATQTQALAPDLTLASQTKKCSLKSFNIPQLQMSSPISLTRLRPHHQFPMTSPTPLNNSHPPHKLPASSPNPLKHRRPFHQTPLRSPKTFKYPLPRLQHPMNWPISLHHQRLHHRPHPLLAHTTTSLPTPVGSSPVLKTTLLNPSKSLTFMFAPYVPSNRAISLKPFVTLIGARLCKLNLMPYTTITHEILLVSPLLRIWLGVNWFFVSNEIRMAPLIITRHG